MSNIYKLKCTCGVESCEIPKSLYSSINGIAKITNFGFVWDISSGLDAMWFCGNCINIINDAWNEILKITGTPYVQIPRRKSDS